MGHNDDINVGVYQIYDEKWIEVDFDKAVMGMCNWLPNNMVTSIYIKHCGGRVFGTKLATKTNSRWWSKWSITRNKRS